MLESGKIVRNFCCFKCYEGIGIVLIFSFWCGDFFVDGSVDCVTSVNF